MDAEKDFPEYIEINPEGIRSGLYIDESGLLLPDSARAVIEVFDDAKLEGGFIESFVTDVRDLLWTHVADELEPEQRKTLNNEMLRSQIVPTFYYWTQVQLETPELADTFALNLNTAIQNYPHLSELSINELWSSADLFLRDDSPVVSMDTATLLTGIFETLKRASRSSHRRMPEDTFETYASLALKVPMTLAMHICDISYAQAVRVHEGIEPTEAEMELLEALGSEDELQEDFKNELKTKKPPVDDRSIAIREAFGLKPADQTMIEIRDFKPKAPRLDDASRRLHIELEDLMAEKSDDGATEKSDDDDQDDDGEGDIPIPA